MEISINGHRTSTLPAFFLFALSHTGSEAIFQMKSPPLKSDKQNMIDSMRLCIRRLERDISEQ